MLLRKEVLLYPGKEKMRFFTKEVYLVTGNENKLREFREILGIDIEMIDKLLSRRMDM